MANETFVAVVDDLTNYHLAALVAAPPGPRGLEAREYHHLIQHALSEIVSSLKGQVDTGAAMKRALDEHEEEDL